MNVNVTSKEEILSKSRFIVMEQGISAINMRTVAKACGVAVGSIYNYFPSKSALIMATIEDVWNDIFHMSHTNFAFEHVTDCIKWLFESIQRGCVKYPGFFTLHSMSFTIEVKENGRYKMEHYFAHMKKNLLDVLEKDSNVRSDAFNEKLSSESFIELIFTLITSMLLRNETNYEPLLEIIERCIY